MAELDVALNRRGKPFDNAFNKRVGEAIARHRFAHAPTPCGGMSAK
jgi:hypothetical protein